MKILHLMWDEKFKKEIANLYDVFFNNGEHEICYINKPGLPSLIEEEFSIVQKEIDFLGSVKDTLKLVRDLKKYDYVVIHSYRIGILASAYFLLDKSLRQKLIWIEWGFDLYVKKPRLGNIKARIKYIIDQAVKKRIGHFVGIFPPDCDYYKKLFPKSKAKVYYAPYCGAKVDDEFLNYTQDCRLKKTKEERDTVYIQIGHYALNRLNHIEVLKSLEKWKDKKIMLFIPLSYGSTAYADEVQKYAETMFPSKTIILRKMMPPEDYFQLTERIDIAIFNTSRQCGLGNIQRLVFRNVKLYMTEGSVMYNFFNEKGVPVQSFDQLCTQSFEEFITPPEMNEAEKFADYLHFLSDNSYRISFWTDIYDKLRGDLKSFA